MNYTSIQHTYLNEKHIFFTQYHHDPLLYDIVYLEVQIILFLSSLAPKPLKESLPVN